jgi:hypothetical protein
VANNSLELTDKVDIVEIGIKLGLINSLPGEESLNPGKKEDTQ